MHKVNHSKGTERRSTVFQFPSPLPDVECTVFRRSRGSGSEWERQRALAAPLGLGVAVGCPSPAHSLYLAFQLAWGFPRPHSNTGGDLQGCPGWGSSRSGSCTPAPQRVRHGVPWGWSLSFQLPLGQVCLADAPTLIRRHGALGKYWSLCSCGLSWGSSCRAESCLPSAEPDGCCLFAELPSWPGSGTQEEAVHRGCARWAVSWAFGHQALHGPRYQGLTPELVHRVVWGWLLSLPSPLVVLQGWVLPPHFCPGLTAAHSWVILTTPHPRVGALLAVAMAPQLWDSHTRFPTLSWFVLSARGQKNRDSGQMFPFSLIPPTGPGT